MNGPGLKVGLKRMTLGERVLGDAELVGCPLVRLLGPTAAQYVLGQSTARRFVDGARLFLEGDPGDALLLVMKGDVRLWVGAGATPVEVATAGKGEFIGEQEALGGSTARAWSAQAVGEVEVVEIPGALVRQCAAKFPAFADHLHTLARARQEARSAITDFLNRW
ncbi:MAG: Crp/Fnr family transcriptional regulator [Myxococcaceae bacterium]|nr:Crp/Fnr family transcriptional regulator [Myxococcaceae bacterium]